MRGECCIATRRRLDYIAGERSPLFAQFEGLTPVLLTMLKSKLHRATVTGADMDYEGSIAIDRDLLEASGMLPNEQVDVLNINTGGRFTTYAIEAPRGTRDIAVNGAAARLVQVGDKVIIIAYCQIPAEEARNYHPTVVVLGKGNVVARVA